MEYEGTINITCRFYKPKITCKHDLNPMNPPGLQYATYYMHISFHIMPNERGLYRSHDQLIPIQIKVAKNPK